MSHSQQHKIWGPGLWRFMHTISFHIPDVLDDETKDAFMDFFYALTLILPCTVCRYNVVESLVILGGLRVKLFETKKSTAQFIYTLHNLINQCVGKRQINPTIQTVERKYNKENTSQSWFWGPGLWAFLHTMSVNMPVVLSNAETEAVILFLRSLQVLIPCSVCRVHFIENTENVVVSDIKSNKSLSLLIYDLHNTVNKGLNRKPYKTFKYVYDKYNLNP